MSERSRRVLVVDDEASERTLLCGLLEGARYVVESAESGPKALDSFRERRPDLMVVDLGMPRVDGWAVLEGLQVLGRLPPVLVLSERGGNPRRGRFRDCIAAYVFKPVVPEEFLGTCRRILDLSARTEAFLAERRSEPRRLLIMEVTLLSSQEQAVRGTLVNLSPRGFQMQLGVPLEPGSLVRAELVAPGCAALHFEGRIRWRTALPGGFLVGGDLSLIGPEAALILEALLLSSTPILA